MLLCKSKPMIIHAQGPQFRGIIVGLGGPIIHCGPGGPYHPSAIAGPSYPSNNYTRYMTAQSNGLERMEFNQLKMWNVTGDQA